MREMIYQLREKLGGLSEAEQGAAAAAIFGTNAMSGWLAIVNGGEADLNKLSDAIDNCSFNVSEINDAVEASGIQWEKYADKAWMATGSLYNFRYSPHLSGIGECHTRRKRLLHSRRLQDYRFLTVPEPVTR